MIKKQYLKGKSLCKVTFTLPKEAAVDAKEVRILGEFNDWSWEKSSPMKASKKEFKTTLELATSQSYQFRYMIDNERWENDWNADDYVATPFIGIQNSVVIIEKAVPAAPAKKKATPTAAKKVVKKKAAPKKATAKKPATKKKVAEKLPTKKAATKKDNLKKVEGVGPKIEQLMNAENIITFNDLSKTKLAKLKAILAAAGSRFKMHNPSTWAAQAKLAAKGKWDELAKLQDELKGGRPK